MGGTGAGGGPFAAGVWLYADGVGSGAPQLVSFTKVVVSGGGGGALVEAGG